MKIVSIILYCLLLSIFNTPYKTFCLLIKGSPGAAFYAFLISPWAIVPAIATWIVYGWMVGVAIFSITLIGGYIYNLAYLNYDFRNRHPKEES